jgi:uncharacterized membrane protein
MKAACGPERSSFLKLSPSCADPAFVVLALLVLAVGLSVAYLLRLGGPWRKTAIVVLGVGLVGGVLAGVGTAVSLALADEPCPDGPCGQHAPLFLGLYLEGLLAHVVVATAVGALVSRAARAVRPRR